MVVATNVIGRTLDTYKLINDFALVFLKFPGQFRKTCLEFRVLRLFGYGFSPVQGKVEVAAAVVDPSELPGGRLVVLQVCSIGCFNGGSQLFGLFVVVNLTKVPQRFRQSKEFAY